MSEPEPMRLDCHVEIDNDRGEVRVIVSGLPQGRAMLLGNCVLPYIQQAVSEAMERPPERLVTVRNGVLTEDLTKQ